MKRHFLIQAVLLVLAALPWSCRQSTEDTSINQELGKLPAALSDTLKKIGGQIQNFEIDPSTGNTIVGQQGTIVLIPANSLVDEQGKPITERTSIQLKECYSIKDIISSNLQTVHNDNILQTKGMIYLAASIPGGKTVRIDKSKPVRIEMPVSPDISGAKFFKGERDENGNMNWISFEDPNKKLVPFPIKMIAPRPDFECRPDFGFTQDPNIWKDTNAKYYYTNDNITKYENTLLATREFKERYYSHCMSALAKIYIANLDKNMWEVDELVVQYFIKDSTERVDFELKNVPPGVNGGKRTKEQEEAHQWLVDHEKEYGHKMIETFKKFASQKLTKVDENLKIDTAKVKEFNKAFIAYEVIEFGWINCDIFYNDPNAEKVKLFVQTNETPSIINIIFRDKRIILNGIEDGQNNFRFTQDREGYNKLPKGDTAIILAIGYRDNQIIFSSKEIIIGQNELEKLDMQIVTAGELHTRLKNYGE
jgi:hypothetical protein